MDKEEGWKKNTEKNTDNTSAPSQSSVIEKSTDVDAARRNKKREEGAADKGGNSIDNNGYLDSGEAEHDGKDTLKPEAHEFNKNTDKKFHNNLINNENNSGSNTAADTIQDTDEEKNLAKEDAEELKEEKPVTEGNPSEEDFLSTALFILENPTRREILKRLVKEVHYPLQLSKELNVSQQAIMKHLKIMEEKGIIRSFEEKSTSGGPPRRCYEVAMSFSISIDIGPTLFNSKIRPLVLEKEPLMERNIRQRHADVREDLVKASKINDLRQRYGFLTKVINEITRRLEELEEERSYLTLLKENALQHAYSIILSMVRNYDQRKILYYIIERSDASLEDISDYYNIRVKKVRALFQELDEMELL
ncbi:MAG: ArsR family transcriptional regulator [Thermoplasmata archaeon]